MKHLVAIALLVAACRGREEIPSSRAAAARPALAQATQADLARDLDDAEHHGTYTAVRQRWQGQHVQWSVIRQKSLCRSAEACHVAAFPIQRPARHGWMPGLAFLPGEYDRLATACGAAEQCEVVIDGTLSEIEGSGDKPTHVRFADVRVVSAKPT